MDDFNFKDKKILLRVDLNSDVKNGKLEFSNKFIEHSNTIQELLEKNAKIVLLAHQGDLKEENLMDLRQHAQFLSEQLKTKVNYVESLTEKDILSKIKKLKEGKILLLKNVLTLKEEVGKKPAKSDFVKKLSPLFDYYINDAFSLTNLSYASIIGFPEKLPNCAGRNLEKELDVIQIITESKQKPVVYILGGDKVDDNVDLAEYILKNKKVDTILTAGLFGQVCLLGRDVRLGSQETYLKNKDIKVSKKLKNLLKDYENSILTPVDLAISTFGIRENIELKYLPIYQDVHDIGPKTISIYKNVIKNAKTIFLKGPIGDYKKSNFEIGTKEILEGVADSEGFSIVVGNDAVRGLEKFEIDKSKISHTSLGGRALIDYLAGKKLVGIEALKIK